MDKHVSVKSTKEILLRRLEMVSVWFEFNRHIGIIVDSSIVVIFHKVQPIFARVFEILS
jgi:hypothetical protein